MIAVALSHSKNPRTHGVIGQRTVFGIAGAFASTTSTPLRAKIAYDATTIHSGIALLDDTHATLGISEMIDDAPADV